MTDFDAWCAERNITPDEAPAAFAAWLNNETGWDGRMDKVGGTTMDHFFPESTPSDVPQLQKRKPVQNGDAREVTLRGRYCVCDARWTSQEEIQDGYWVVTPGLENGECSAAGLGALGHTERVGG